MIDLYWLVLIGWALGYYSSMVVGLILDKLIELKNGRKKNT